ncbi:MAG: restriction endonuclease subunit S [Idiomarina sp.]|nr:restriction endonuclease subunit S [Idiomarina sp.]
MSIAAYPNHIETDSARFKSIPSHWKLVPCRAIVEEIAERNSDGKNQNYLSLMANVGVIRYEDKGDVGNKKPDDLAKCKVVRVGNLVINSMNYGIGSYGLSAFNGVCSPVYIVLNAIESVLNERFALRIFEEKQFQSFAQSFGNGILAHRAAIGWDDLKKIEVPLPPLPEQTQIARFLDHETAKIDALIAEQKRLIELLKEMRQAVISHAVTKGLDPNVPMKDSGVEWLGDVPEHWDIGRLKHLLRIRGGQDYKAVESDNPADYPVIGSGGQFTYAKSFLYEGESVLLGRKGTIDKPLYIKGKFWTVDTMFFTEILPRAYGKFAYYLATTIPFGLYSTNTALPSMSQFDLANHKLPIPPVSEQAQIALYLDERIRKIDALTNEATKSIRYMNERRSALISAAVTGKIDVRNWRPPADESAFPADVRQVGLEETA